MGEVWSWIKNSTLKKKIPKAQPSVTSLPAASKAVKKVFIRQELRAHVLA